MSGLRIRVRVAGSDSPYMALTASPRGATDDNCKQRMLSIVVTDCCGFPLMSTTNAEPSPRPSTVRSKPHPAAST